MKQMLLMQRLKMLAAQHPKQEDQEPSRLKVYYGFSKINKSN